MKLSELIAGMDATLVGGDAEILGIAIDSRRALPGDLFFALKGSQHNGEEFVADAIARGAAAVVSSVARQVPTAICADPRDLLWRAAQRFYSDPTADMLCIGITGTNGKTSAAYILESILNAAGYRPAVMGTLGFRFDQQEIETGLTTPEANDILRLIAKAKADGANALAMEVSSHALDQKRAHGIRFDAAGFLNLTQDHLDYHGTMESYAESKLALFTDLASDSFVSAICVDDEWGRWMAARARGRLITCGLSGDIRAEEIEATTQGIRFVVAHGTERLPVEMRLTAPFHVQNALVAVAISIGVGIERDAIVEGLRSAPAAPGRFEVVRSADGATAIVDYAHTPDALERALMAARRLTDGRLIVVFGCGGDRDATKRPIMGEIAARLADRAIVTSDNPRTEDPRKILDDIDSGISSELKERRLIEADRRRAIEIAVEMARPGDLILLAGKGHETYQIIGTEKLPFDDKAIVSDCFARSARL